VWNSKKIVGGDPLFIDRKHLPPIKYFASYFGHLGPVYQLTVFISKEDKVGYLISVFSLSTSIRIMYAMCFNWFSGPPTIAIPEASSSFFSSYSFV
jgi:hypothetical protein